MCLCKDWENQFVKWMRDYRSREKVFGVYCTKESANETLLASINVIFDSTGFACSFRILLGYPADYGAEGFFQIKWFLVTIQPFMFVAKLKHTMSAFGIRPILRKSFVFHFSTRWGHSSTMWTMLAILSTTSFLVDELDEILTKAIALFHSHRALWI